MTPDQPCPLCFRPSSVMVKPTRRGGKYFRCYGCTANGFINNDWGMRGFVLMANLLASVTVEELVASLGLNGESAYTKVIDVIRSRSPATSKELPHAAAAAATD